MPDTFSLSPAEREALKNEILSSLRCALPGTVLSFDAETQTADIRPAARPGTLSWPDLSGVPVFMPVPFDISPGDACLVVFADLDIDSWFSPGSDAAFSTRKHSLSDGFAFVGFRTSGSPAGAPDSAAGGSGGSLAMAETPDDTLRGGT